MNSFTIFQTKEETQLAVTVHQNAEINDVRLARAKVTADRPTSNMKNPIAITMGVKSRQVEGPVGQILIEVSFRLAGATKKSDQPKNRTAVCVECTFEVGYQLKPGFAPTEEQIRAFKEGNAIFNCWPYCRQYVQESIIRMGFPPLILPFLRVQTRHREIKKLSKPE